MRNIKIIIEYNGTNLSGWQIQPDKRTVQGDIEHALKIIFKKNIPLYGSGRTDAGVHALGQVANFKIDSLMKTKQIVRALNGNLKDDITILNAKEVADNFHSRFSAKQKTYCYTILNRPTRSTIKKDFVWHIQQKINIAAMRKDAKNLIGKHNFRSFTANDPAKSKTLTSKDTTRTIYDLAIDKKGDIITIKITANGFLYKMVRNIVGTLSDIGTGALASDSVKNILKAKSRISARATAPAKGLTLLKVFY